MEGHNLVCHTVGAGKLEIIGQEEAGSRATCESMKTLRLLCKSKSGGRDYSLCDRLQDHTIIKPK